MTSGSFRFETFTLDGPDRRLLQDDRPVELNGRYFDALALLVSESGKLVSKDRFLDEVWRGVPVTDEALTQCIRTLRRQLGDDAARPRFIETVPKHGYRFIAPVERVGEVAPVALGPVDHRSARKEAIQLARAGTIGGVLAGLIGSPLYGFAAASEAAPGGMGAASVVLVLVCLALLISVLGAAGVSGGIAAARMITGRAGPWSVAGGALGGLLIGAVVKLIGLDAFNLLVGRAPANITGPAEGALIGGAIGLAAWLALGQWRLRIAGPIGALAGGTAGVLVVLAGGRMLGGSLDLLAEVFPDSRLRLDAIGRLFGEQGFGPVSQVVSGGLEGALFGGCIVAAMFLAEERLRAQSAV